MGWTEADFAALEAEMGPRGPYPVQRIPGQPEMIINLDGLEALVIDGKLKAEDVLRAPVGEVTDLEAANAERLQRAAAYQDAVLAAGIMDPPYCRMVDVPPDGRTPGRIHFWMFAPAARRRTDDLIVAGGSGLAAFLADLAQETAAPADPAPLETSRPRRPRRARQTA
jgi:hypothetical protein